MMVPARALARPWPRLLPWGALLVLSAALHFVFFARPLTVVFDEVYFPKYAMAYLRGEHYFDLHPPLGKLILYLAGWLADLQPTFSFAENHLPFPDASYLWLRVPPRIAGTLLPLVLVAVALELGMSRLAAFVVGVLAALDNALLVISRFALLDSFLLLFGFGALWCYLRARRGERAWFAAAALAAGAAAAVKWTGLAFLGLILLAEGWRWLRTRKLAGIGRIAAAVALAAAVYVASFAAHFALGHKSGRDDAAMSRAFQATLLGNPNASDPALARPGFWARFVELHIAMYDGHRRTVERHPYSSHWYDWPFMMRSVDFWAEHKDGRIAHIYFLGNPVVWWTAGYCMLFLLVNFPPRLFNLLVRREAGAIGVVEAKLVVAYLANLLPFVFIGRIMFSYHYLAALCVALLATGYLLDRCGEYRRVFGSALLALAVAAFVYFAPLSYALPLAPEQFEARFWVRGWR
ncbi:MAG TPA: phospholipid carrier-dependent glycosyltransferase [Burkholderiaceae bacterium]|nr:phospholipid carrier-dependent glycosyltransferase [Burkholderiaceae bacterium]